MHLTKDVKQKSTDRRATGFNLNYLANENEFVQRLQERRPSPGTLQLLRSRQSIDSNMSNGSTIPRHLRQQQAQSQVVRSSRTDVAYCFQRISNV